MLGDEAPRLANYLANLHRKLLLRCDALSPTQRIARRRNHPYERPTLNSAADAVTDKQGNTKMSNSLIAKDASSTIVLAAPAAFDKCLTTIGVDNGQHSVPSALDFRYRQYHRCACELSDRSLANNFFFGIYVGIGISGETSAQEGWWEDVASTEKDSRRRRRRR